MAILEIHMRLPATMADGSLQDRGIVVYDTGEMDRIDIPHPDPEITAWLAANTPTPYDPDFGLTPAEIIARDEYNADKAELETLRAVRNDMFNGVGTNLERLVRVEKVLARILKRYRD